MDGPTARPARLPGSSRPPFPTQSQENAENPHLWGLCCVGLDRKPNMFWAVPPPPDTGVRQWRIRQKQETHVEYVIKH
jgi:hypothetical protein